MKPLIHIPDPEKASGFYDACVNTSPNGLIYAFSWYLDIVCPDWEILSTDDHTTVMPLPVSKSLGRKIIRQPGYAWQLGIFSTRIPSPEVVQHFLRSIPPSYRLRSLCLNKFNVVPSRGVRSLNSAELDLIRPFAMIRSGYGPSMQQSLELSREHSLSFMDHISVQDMLMFAYRLDRFNRRRLKPSDISMLRLIATNAIRFRAGQICAAYDSHNNLCATVTFLVHKGRAEILHAAASGDGLSSGAIEYIIDRFIELHAEQNLILCIDNPLETRLMDILKSCGSGISVFPCVRHKGR